MASPRRRAPPHAGGHAAALPSGAAAFPLGGTCAFGRGHAAAAAPGACSPGKGHTQGPTREPLCRRCALLDKSQGAALSTLSGWMAEKERRGSRMHAAMPCSGAWAVGDGRSGALPRRHPTSAALDGALVLRDAALPQQVCSGCASAVHTCVLLLQSASLLTGVCCQRLMQPLLPQARLQASRPSLCEGAVKTDGEGTMHACSRATYAHTQQKCPCPPHAQHHDRLLKRP